MKPVIALAVLAACGQPPLTLTFDVTSGAEDACFITGNQRASACSDVTLPCRAVVSIRVYSPDDETSPYISVCQELTGQPDLCAIAGVDLPDPPQAIPDQTLEVDIVVFPYSAATIDPATGDLECPVGVQFDANGFPIGADQPCIDAPAMQCPPDPAIGGRAFYHPGDSVTNVALGCVDIAQVDSPTCSGSSSVDVMAAVDDFDTDESVQPTLADELTVSVGEPEATPTGSGTQYTLDPADAFPLELTTMAPVPGWSAEIGASFTSPCVEVLEDGAEMTATLACKSHIDPAASSLQFEGWRLSKSTLDQILGALGMTEFPDAGLVVGVVLDPLGNPLANQTVTSGMGTIEYVSADRTTIVAGETSSSGIFVSTDAGFGTSFSVASGVQAASGYGGLVEGKVTIVVLQYQNPVQD
ncbi:MAG TPA: hypothetical protein VH143_00670 [Kofleriaceae bacterium]|nr:hypothetical protein [Kofleriaceae bacterium]